MSNPFAPRPLAGAAVLLGVLSLSRVGEAAPASRLVYGRTLATATCPDEPELRASVRSRLGYDPFFPWAGQTIVVHVAQRANRRLVGKVYLVDPEGRASPEREFTTSADECAELVETLALAIVITLDPLHGMTAAAAPSPAAATATGSTDKGPPSTSANSPEASPRSSDGDGENGTTGGRSTSRTPAETVAPLATNAP